MGKAHVAAIRGNSRRAMALLDEGRRVFDTAGSDDAESDYAVPRIEASGPSTCKETPLPDRR